MYDKRIWNDPVILLVYVPACCRSRNNLQFEVQYRSTYPTLHGFLSSGRRSNVVACMHDSKCKTVFEAVEHTSLSRLNRR